MKNPDVAERTGFSLTSGNAGEALDFPGHQSEQDHHEKIAEGREEIALEK